MESFYLLLCGFGLGGVLYLLRQYAGRWYQWVLAIALYVWICLGISFVYINSVGYHHKAATVGGIFFGIVAVAGAFIVARTMGLVGKKMKTQDHA